MDDPRTPSGRRPTAMDVTPPAARDESTVSSDGERLRRIDGVEHVSLRPHIDHRGMLIETINLTNPFWREPVVHAYAFTIRPGRIKGWGLHKLSADRYAPVRGRVRVVLYDGRPESPTYERFEEWFFDDAARGLLRIPPGVWHADQNIGEEEVIVLNFPTRSYDPANPDKYRLDPHGDAIPFDWALRDG